tara:strand:+ start:18077 stop:18622 length:546 start_codon:yes stop_codon:yes gene_type:complete
VKIESTLIPEVKILTPAIHKDRRGYFYESYKSEFFDQHGLPSNFVQDNQVQSKQKVIRGFHYQLAKPQGKLIRVVSGQVIDVAVDLRLGSPTFAKYVKVELSDKNNKSLYIPEGFGHGYLVLSKESVLLYKCTNLYDPMDEYGIVWNDKTINIDWGCKRPVISKKDLNLPILSEQKFLPKY